MPARSQRPSVICGRYRPPCLRARPPRIEDRRLWGEPPTPLVPVSGTDRKWSGRGRRAGDSPRDRAEPGPGVASPPMPPRPSAPVLRGSRRGPAPGAGLGDGWGAVGGGAGPPGRGSGSSYRGPVPRVLPVGVARRRHWASACRRGAVRTQLVGGRRRGCGSCGAIRVQQAGSPSRGWWSSGRLATGRALPCRVEGRGGLPGGRCRGGGHGRGPVAVGPSPVRVAEVPAVRDLLPSRRAMRGGRRRARSARPVAKCVWARCRGRSPPLTPRRAGSPGVPPRRRGGRRRGHDPRPL